MRCVVHGLCTTVCTRILVCPVRQTGSEVIRIYCDTAGGGGRTSSPNPISASRGQANRGSFFTPVENQKHLIFPTKMGLC